MSSMIFVNVAVASVQASREFFTQVGYTFNEQFSDDTTAAMTISDAIVFMLHEPDKFTQFTADRAIADMSTSIEALFALNVDSRDEVDALLGRALGAGATEFRDPEDHGFMYGRSYADLDGHVWEITWMDLSQMPTE